MQTVHIELDQLLQLFQPLKHTFNILRTGEAVTWTLRGRHWSGGWGPGSHYNSAANQLRDLGRLVSSSEGLVSSPQS